MMEPCHLAKSFCLYVSQPPLASNAYLATVYDAFRRASTSVSLLLEWHGRFAVGENRARLLGENPVIQGLFVG